MANRFLWNDPSARFFGSFMVDPSWGTTLEMSAADGSEGTLDLWKARGRLPDKAMATVVGAPRRIDSSAEENYITRSGHPQGMTPHGVRKLQQVRSVVDTIPTLAWSARPDERYRRRRSLGPETEADRR